MHPHRPGRSLPLVAVIFKVPRDGCRQSDLDAAAALEPLLTDANGFLSIERFKSLAQPGRLLSLSFGRDEAAIAAWRNWTRIAARNAPGASSFLPTTCCGLPTSRATTA